MSTKTETTGSNSTAFQFAPGAVDLWSKNVQQWLPFAQGLYQNPFGNQMFQQENSIGQDQAANIGQRNKSNILNNANALGYGTNGGMFNSMLQRAGRDTGNMQANAFRGAVGNANQRAMTGLGVSSNFQPLMVGSNSNYQNTQQQSGLGTWLPQAAGAAIGAGTAAATAGMSKVATTGASAAGSGIGAAGAGMSSMASGIGNMFSGGGGYGYGAGTQSNGAWVNPFMFGGTGTGGH